MRWMQVAIKPAKPFAFGTIDGVPVFGLPGNPVSSLVSFELLARPALRRMMGHPDPFRPAIPAVADGGLRRRPGRQDPPRPRRRRVRRRRAAARRSRSPPRAAISWRRRRWPTPWRRRRRRRRSRPAATSRRSCSPSLSAAGCPRPRHAIRRSCGTRAAGTLGDALSRRSGDIERAGRTKSTWLMWWPAHLPATADSIRAASSSSLSPRRRAAAQVGLVGGEQARAELPVGGQADPVAVAAERLGHARDHADGAAAVEVAPAVGGRRAAGRDLLERVHRVDAGDDLVLADDLVGVPAAAGVERHPLDEPHLDAVAVGRTWRGRRSRRR